MRRLAQGIAAALAMAVVVPGTVSAATYAVSINEITNFNMWVSGGSISHFTFTYSNDAAALDGVGSSNVNNMDAPGACVGTACAGWDNQFIAHNATTSDFSYGDAQILSLPVLGGAQGAASAIGETLSGNGIGFGMGSNTLIASFNVQTAGTQLHFGFDADMLLQTVLGSGGIGAAASSAMQITINGPGYQFLWTPDGQTGGITGGTESADAFSLNQGISGTDLFSASSANMGFHAVTNGLGEGSYTMNITMTQTANVSAVPVPAAVWLLGSGLLGLVAVARRRVA